MPHSHSPSANPLLWTTVLLSDSPVQNVNYVIIYILPTYIIVSSVSDARQAMGSCKSSDKSYRVSRLVLVPLQSHHRHARNTPLFSFNILLWTCMVYYPPSPTSSEMFTISFYTYPHTRIRCRSGL